MTIGEAISVVVHIIVANGFDVDVAGCTSPRLVTDAAPLVIVLLTGAVIRTMLGTTLCAQMPGWMKGGGR